jgi:hypothetical protein
MASKNLIRLKEEELQCSVFKWAEQNGLARVIGQVRISIRINKNTDTAVLTASDWASVLSEKNEWDLGELQFLKRLKGNKNQPTTFPDGLNFNRFKYNLKRLHPIFLSRADSDFCLKKWLAFGKKKYKRHYPKSRPRKTRR